MKQFVLKYLIGGYVFGRVVEDFMNGETHEDVLNQFWKRYDGMLDCVKPIILGLYLRKNGDTRPVWEKNKIELTKYQKRGVLICIKTREMLLKNIRNIVEGVV